jgi:glucuronokinase
VGRFARECDPRASSIAVSWRTGVPRGVGLGGSSAIVIATARALCDLLAVSVAPERLAAFALAVETEELGIAAGLQDRIAQAYGGLTFMDFAAMRFEPLDPATLPPLLIAWGEDTAAESGAVHEGLRARFERGDATVADGMRALASAAREARASLERGDREAFARCADASFDARQRMMGLDARHVALIRAARDRGASANYAGSGGAIVAVCRDGEHRAAVLEGLADQFAAIAA